MCGVFGVYGHPNGKSIVKTGIWAEQHRGQDAAGVACLRITGETWDYTNWMPGQPDNNSLPENENRLVFWGRGTITPTWNDYVPVLQIRPEDRVWGYAVEFDTPPTALEETTWGQITATFH